MKGTGLKQGAWTPAVFKILGRSCPSAALYGGGQRPCKASLMFRQNGVESMDRSSNGTDSEEEEREPVSSQFNTSNFGNFLEVHYKHRAL